MGLHKRTVYIFIITILLSASAAIGVSRYFYVQGYGRLEEREAMSSMLRTLALMDDDLDQLNVQVRDWASWDDTYGFVLNGDGDYEASNLGESTFESLGLSGMSFMDTQGRSRFTFAENPDASEAFLAMMRPLAADLPADMTAGVVRAGNGLHVVVVRPILKSDGSGPGVGLLLMARPLDAGRLDRYSRLLGLRVTLDIRDYTEGSSVVLAKSTDSIRVSMPLLDTGKQAVGLLSVDAPRTIYRYGVNSLLYYLAVVAAAMGIIAFAALFILETLVFRSIRSIGTQLDRISSGDFPDARLSVPLGDEVGAMAGAMNRTLEALNVRIRERDALLREIHHRVKNNLQIIASMLSLQASRSGSPEVREALGEGRRRVMAMAIVHNELYDDPDLSRINLGDLVRSYAASVETDVEHAGPVEFELRMDEIFVEIDQAVPLGLILSEVFSNAYRHAFPDYRKGTIRVASRRETGDGIVLEISDDGIGIPPAEVRTSGLGLLVVEALASQLRGSIAIDSPGDGGTRYTLRVPA